MLRIGLSLAILLGSLANGTYAQTPRRVVSFNLCADQLVVALADPEQILALSPYAADETVSVVADAARRYPRLGWQAESTLTLNPDLVLVGTDDRMTTQHMLKRFGVRVATVDLVADIEAARRQIHEIAGLLGHPERGEKMIADLATAENKLAGAPRPGFKTALILDRGGYTQGTESLVSVLIAKAGLSAPKGAPQGYGGIVPLETILTLKPDVLVMRDPPNSASDQGAVSLLHPALMAMYPPQRRIALATRYTFCGGPALIAALDYLANEMTRLAQRPAN
jgi:iron complex transport system substrate-binding protein